MNKGQLFSIDLLFGVILLIFGTGLLLGAAEINTYNQKQQINHDEIMEKTILAAQVITNSSEWDCNFDGTHAAYSLNRDKFLSTFGNTLEKIKQKANLIDYNIRINLGEEIIYDNIITSKELIVFDLNVLTCTNTTDFNMLKKCMDMPNGPACYSNNIRKEIFRLMVAK